MHNIRENGSTANAKKKAMSDFRDDIGVEDGLAHTADTRERKMIGLAHAPETSERKTD